LRFAASACIKAQWTCVENAVPPRWLQVLRSGFHLMQVTLFAPSNEAFLRLFPSTELDELLAGAANATSPLQTLLLSHSVPSPVFAGVKVCLLACWQQLSRWAQTLRC